MANYPKELTDLLEQYLTDGVMTAKERGVLLRKAEAMNVDKDEFDLYIDAEIQKIDQKADAIKRQSKGKLCPFCDASIPVLADKCPECGGSITPEATKELEEIIEKLEDALVDLKSRRDFKRSKAMVERYIRKAELYYESNPKVKILLGAVKSEMKTAERKAATDNAIDNAKRIAAGMLENKYVRWVIGVILLVILIHYLFQYLYQEWWWFF
jgi:ribosomal protein L40E